jgi:hypothetical protein
MKKIVELLLSLLRNNNLKTYPILFSHHFYFEHYVNKGVVIQISH